MGPHGGAMGPHGEPMGRPWAGMSLVRDDKNIYENTGNYKKILENMEKHAKPRFGDCHGRFKAREASQRLPGACGIHPV